MNAKLKEQFDELEVARKAMFDSLRGYSDEQLNKQPVEGKWSVMQVMDHLMMSESASLHYLQKKTLDLSKAVPAGFRGQWRLFMLKVFFNIPTRYKAPAMLEPSKQYMTQAQAEAQWDQIRNDLYKLLATLPDADLEKDIWKHVSAGKMNIYQMLEFLGMHFSRHRKQIDTTITAVSRT